MVERLMGVPEAERIRKLTRRSEKEMQLSKLPGLSTEQLLSEIQLSMSLSNEMFMHNNFMKDDEDASDSIKFDLSPNEGATVQLYVPTGYVMLLTRFVLSDFDDNAYTLYLDDNPYILGPELNAPRGFLAIDENTVIQFIVLNSGIYTNEYLAELRALYRRKSEWKWPTIKAKSQVGTGGY